MADKKAIVLATFVQEMYIILFGIGIGNIVFINKIDFSTLLGFGHVVSAIFEISVTVNIPINKYRLNYVS